MSHPPSRMAELIAELGRRRVFRTAALYALLAIVVVEVTDTAVDPLGLPLQTLPLVAWAVILGFPIAVGLAWTFDVTPRGIVRTLPESDIERVRRRLSAQVGFRLTLTGFAAAAVGATTWTVMEPFLPDIREARAVAPGTSLPAGSVLVAPVRLGEGVEPALAEHARLLLVQRLSEVPGLLPLDPRRIDVGGSAGSGGDADATVTTDDDVAAATDEPTSDSALDEARDLGAERVLTATLDLIPGDASDAPSVPLRLTVSLEPVAGGEPVTVSADGSADDLEGMVERLVSEIESATAAGAAQGASPPLDSAG